MRIWIVMISLVALAGCAATPELSDGYVAEPENRVSALCAAGKYHEAMRELPAAMDAWDAYTERTGSTTEGAAGLFYANTLFDIAGKGDADWGKILDDPDIPYAYKADMMTEILEARIGKGVVTVDDEGNFVFPRE